MALEDLNDALTDSGCKKLAAQLDIPVHTSRTIIISNIRAWAVSNPPVDAVESRVVDNDAGPYGDLLRAPVQPLPCELIFKPQINYYGPACWFACTSMVAC